MAVAEMQKLNLVAMSYDRDEVLNALQRTGAVELKTHYEAENTECAETDCESLKSYLARIESALELVSGEVDNYNKEHKIKSDELKDGFSVSYTDFMSAKNLKERVDGLVDRVYSLDAERKNLLGEALKYDRQSGAAEIYGSLTLPFSHYSDSAHARIKLGVISEADTDKLNELSERELFDYQVIAKGGEQAVVALAFHKSVDADSALGGINFVSCPYREGTGEELCAGYKKSKDDALKRVAEIDGEIIELGKDVKIIKIYCDYVSFELEKLMLGEKMRKTAKTCLMEAYLPKTAEKAVAAALDEVSAAVYYEFSEPSADEMPPTLYKNNEIVKNFETITNMYSPVNAKEFDPNGVMAFFYSLFLGFIMGDIGYGLIMLLGGGFIYMKKHGEDSGLKRISGVFAVGGIFAIIWGFLFNSLFGIGIFESSVIPDAQRARWGLMGIQVPSVLLISLEIGVCHLMVGYVCRAIQCMRRGQFWDGILDGLVWAVFSVGVGLAIVGLIDEAEMPALATVGGITAGATLVIAMLTAGRKEKLLGKFTKGFGAAYGIINYASDILSYARLYGLMLSGAVIAQIVSGYAVTGMNGGTGFLMSGNPALIILGVVLLVVGHVFNLAIGLLGAYIHDARLQYVEFYGRFYEGEGELFAPLGSNHKFIKLEKSAVYSGGNKS